MKQDFHHRKIIIIIAKGCRELVKKYSEGEVHCQNHLIYQLGIKQQKEFTPDILHFLRENGGKFIAHDYCCSIVTL